MTSELVNLTKKEFLKSLSEETGEERSRLKDIYKRVTSRIQSKHPNMDAGKIDKHARLIMIANYIKTASNAIPVKVVVVGHSTNDMRDKFAIDGIKEAFEAKKRVPVDKDGRPLMVKDGRGEFQYVKYWPPKAGEGDYNNPDDWKPSQISDKPKSSLLVFGKRPSGKKREIFTISAGTSIIGRKSLNILSDEIPMFKVIELRIGSTDKSAWLTSDTYAGNRIFKEIRDLKEGELESIIELAEKSHTPIKFSGNVIGKHVKPKKNRYKYFTVRAVVGGVSDAPNNPSNKIVHLAEAGMSKDRYRISVYVRAHIAENISKGDEVVAMCQGYFKKDEDGKETAELRLVIDALIRTEDMEITFDDIFEILEADLDVEDIDEDEDEVETKVKTKKPKPKAKTKDVDDFDEDDDEDEEDEEDEDDEEFDDVEEEPEEDLEEEEDDW